MPTDLPDLRQRSRAARAELDFAMAALLAGIAAIMFSLALLMHMHSLLTTNDAIDAFQLQHVTPTKRCFWDYWPNLA